MVNYQQGKIYKIRAGNQLYVGSTTRRYLCQRWVRHKYAFKCQTSKLYREMRRVGLDNCSKCILVEKFPCKSKDELRAREDYWRNIDTRSSNVAAVRKRGGVICKDTNGLVHVLNITQKMTWRSGDRSDEKSQVSNAPVVANIRHDMLDTVQQSATKNI
jgi:hypothetical protein